MSRYDLTPIGPNESNSPALRQARAGMAGNAKAPERQRTIEYLTKRHGINLKTTKSLRYDPTFTRRAGINVKRDIRIGPSAFDQDLPWLANVIFHEVVHSDQFACYEAHGVSFAEPGNETERLIVALDEFEGFFWPWYRRQALGLSAGQAAELKRELTLWSVDLDDPPIRQLALKGKFRTARDTLIGRLGGLKKSA